MDVEFNLAQFNEKLLKLLDRDTTIEVEVDGQGSQFAGLTYDLDRNRLIIKVFSYKDLR